MAPSNVLRVMSPPAVVESLIWRQAWAKVPDPDQLPPGDDLVVQMADEHGWGRWQANFRWMAVREGATTQWCPGSPRFFHWVETAK